MWQFKSKKKIIIFLYKQKNTIVLNCLHLVVEWWSCCFHIQFLSSGRQQAKTCPPEIISGPCPQPDYLIAAGSEIDLSWQQQLLTIRAWAERCDVQLNIPLCVCVRSAQSLTDKANTPIMCCSRVNQIPLRARSDIKNPPDYNEII